MAETSAFVAILLELCASKHQATTFLWNDLSSGEQFTVSSVKYRAWFRLQLQIEFSNLNISDQQKTRYALQCISHPLLGNCFDLLFKDGVIECESETRIPPPFVALPPHSINCYFCEME
jgi:hypothetical protein